MSLGKHEIQSDYHSFYWSFYQPADNHLCGFQITVRFAKNSRISSDINAEPIYDEFSPLLKPSVKVPYHGVLRIAPVVLFYGLAYGTYTPSYFELMRYKICDKHLNLSHDICRVIGGKQHIIENDLIRSATAEYQIYSSILECVPAIFLSFFLGSWSDRFGRKWLMTFPFFGMLFAAAWSALCSYQPFPVEYLLLSSALSAMLGGRFILLMAFYSYAGDSSTSTNRAFNNAIVEGLNILGMHTGYFISGYVYQYFNSAAPFLISTCLFTAAILYTMVCVHNHNQRIEHLTLVTSGRRNIFSLINLKEGFGVLTKERTGDTRFHIFLAVLASLISNSAFNGKTAVTQMFLEFRPFSWTFGHYTRFASILGLCGSISVVFFAAIIRKHVGSDTAMAMIAYVSAITGYLIYSVAYVDWMIYVAAALGHLRLLCTVCIRSTLQELAGPDDIGKIMAVVSVVQSISPLIGSVSFVHLFALTASWWSGLCFAVGSFFLIIDLAIFSYIDVVRRDWLYSKIY